MTMRSEHPSSRASRTGLAAKGSFYGLVGRGAGLVLAFALRTVLIYTLGQQYLGINSLYAGILNVLSFAELGFGSAMTFTLYEPVAKKQDERVRELLQFYKWAYRAIALIIGLAGVCLLPFLPHLVQGAESISAFELRLYFAIFLANTVTSYFVTYKFGLVNALQQSYVRTNTETATSVACGCAQIAALMLTSDFLTYLIANTATLSLSRVVIAWYLNTRYPMLRQAPKRVLPKEERRSILHEVKGLAVHQFSNVAVHATDSIIIAAVPALGVAMVGAVSNYNAIVNAVLSIMLVFVNSTVAGFGNLAAVESKRRFKSVFDEINFMGFWMAGIFTATLCCLSSPLIRLWAGESYVIENASLALILLNFYLQGQSSVYNSARIAKGDFNRDKWWSLAQALTNLVVSIACAPLLGLVGVYVGTVASRLMFVISRPCVTYRFLFGQSPASYFRDSARYLLATGAACAFCLVATAPLLKEATWLSVGGAAILCLAVSNVCFFAIFRTDSHFKAATARVRALIGGGYRG